MALQFQAIRGMHDVLPDQTPLWRHVESCAQQILASYGYQEIRFPVVERTELFQRATGTATDIVEKEMYTFSDRNGDSLSLRPEGTPVCVRAGIEHGLLYHQEQRWWYYGPMFRHERPQLGRCRQFFQLGVEAFGMAAPEIDAELILLTHRLWQKLGIRQKVTLQINSLGSPTTRVVYREQLVAYLNQHYQQLDEDSKRRLQTNPLRILDSKNPALQDIISAAPKLLEVLDPESAQHFERFKALLDAAGVVYEVNPNLVRGLDYYNRTVFEWVTNELGTQNTVCAGGRYDGLVELLAGKPTPAVGFAMGLERILLLLKDRLVPIKAYTAYFVMVGEPARLRGLQLAEELRNQLPGLSLLMDGSAGNFKQQLKRADKSGADIALILGEDELARAELIIKDLRQQEAQQTLNWAELMLFLKTKLES